LQLKSVARDHNKAKKEVEKLSTLNNVLSTKNDKLEEIKINNEQEIQRLQQRCKELEDKLKFDASAVSCSFHELGSR
jgi:predicted nuclease with TOPRIM domain